MITNKRNGIINNKRKQEKTIKKLELMRSMYMKLATIDYREEREKLMNGEMSEMRHSSEDFETFETRRCKKREGLLALYNRLNEKLPHHMRLDLLE